MSKVSLLPVGWTGLRYPGGDPENGPAYRQRWTGSEWVCAGHEWEEHWPGENESGVVCKHCYARKGEAK